MDGRDLLTIYLIGFVVLGVLFSAARASIGKNYMDAGAWGFFFGLFWPLALIIVLFGLAGKSLNSGTKGVKR